MKARRAPTIQDVEIALRIDVRLRQAGVTRAELARRLGVSPARVTNVLHGAESNLRVDSLTAIAEALDCRLVVSFEPRRR